MSRKRIDLLLIGKTGNGKSATGNSILAKKVFESKSTCESVTSVVQHDVTEYKERLIKVVDGPGVGDTHHIDDVSKATMLVIDKMQDAVILNPEGFNAFLLVIKFGNRLTTEDKECIRILKAIFGQEFIRTYCILIVTNGDYFRNEKKSTGTTFKKWCSQQEGIFKELYTECNNRVVLFDNVSNDSQIQKKQMAKLVKLIDEMQSGERRYTDKHFQFAKENRDKLMANVTEPLIRQHIIETMSILIHKLDKINKQDISLQYDKLKVLLHKAEDLYAYVQNEPFKSDYIKDSLTNIENFCKRLLDQIQYCETVRIEREKVTKKEEEIQRLEEAFEKKVLEDEKAKDEFEKKIEETIRLKEKQLEEEFSVKVKQIKLDFENERRKAIELKEKQIQELASRSTEEALSVHKAKIEAETIRQLETIAEREKAMSKSMELEKVRAKELIEEEKSKHAEELTKMEQMIRSIKADHEQEKVKMKLLFALLLEDVTKSVKNLLTAQTIESENKMKELMEKYNSLKQQYENDIKKPLKKMKKRNGCKSQ